MIETGSALDPGRKRMAYKNQDCLAVLTPETARPSPTLLVIADGMGGYEGGAVASQLVVDSFSKTYRQMSAAYPPEKVLRAAVTRSFEAMHSRADEEAALNRMGSTVVATLVDEHEIFLLNVGDSRAYLIDSWGLRQISFDHSLVGEHLRQGLITANELRDHPRRNILSMSISVQRDDIDIYTARMRWQRGDTLVLCSDGLWGPVLEDQIRAAVLARSPQKAADHLVNLANQNSGPDNIAVIVARNMG